MHTSVTSTRMRKNMFMYMLRLLLPLYAHSGTRIVQKPCPNKGPEPWVTPHGETLWDGSERCMRNTMAVRDYGMAVRVVRGLVYSMIVVDKLLSCVGSCNNSYHQSRLNQCVEPCPAEHNSLQTCTCTCRY